jgi:hypothetical protein
MSTLDHPPVAGPNPTGRLPAVREGGDARPTGDDDNINNTNHDASPGVVTTDNNINPGAEAGTLNTTCCKIYYAADQAEHTEPARIAQATPHGECQAEVGTAERSSCGGRHTPDHISKKETGRGVTPPKEGPPTGTTGTRTGATPTDNDIDTNDDNNTNPGDNRAAATGDGCSGPRDDGGGGQAAATGDGCSGLNGEDRGDSHDDDDDDDDGCDSDGYGPGEGYYPDGGYEFASALAEASAWEYVEELTRADELSRN